MERDFVVRVPGGWVSRSRGHVVRDRAMAGCFSRTVAASLVEEWWRLYGEIAAVEL